MRDYAVLAAQWQMERLSSDVYPEGGDGLVNFRDWAVFAASCQDTINMDDVAAFLEQWLQFGAYCADMAPAPDGDGRVDFLDVAILALHWLEGTGP